MAAQLREGASGSWRNRNATSASCQWMSSLRNSEPRRRLLLALGFLSGVFLAIPSWADGPVPVEGSESRVNTDSQGYQSQARVVAAPDGAFIVAWTDYPPQGYPDPGHIEARRFTGDGLPVDSTDLRVSPAANALRAWHSDVAATAEGTFLVAWEGGYGGYPGPELAREIRARRFGLRGQALDDPPIAVNTETVSSQNHPAASPTADGGFVVVWDSDDSYVRGRRFRANGEPVDPEDLSLSPLADQSLSPAVAALPDGGFLVVWENWNGFGLLARRIAADGTHADPVPFFVNTTNDGYQYDPQVASDPSGDFVVVWENYDYGAAGPDVTIRARRFAADGTSRDQEDWLVSTSPTANHGEADVAVDAEGNFVVAWTSFTKPGLPSVDATVMARRFRSDASPADAIPMRLSTDDGPYVHEAQPSVNAMHDGDLLAVWLRLQQGGPEEADVWMRRFGRPTIAVTAGGGTDPAIPCSLVEAITAANTAVAAGGCPAGNEGAVIELPPGGSFRFSTATEGVNALPVIRRSVTIRGNGSRIERDPALPCPGVPDLRLFEVADGGILTLEDVELRGGCSGGAGGAVLASGGTVILRKTKITGHRAGGDGGGVAVVDGNLYVHDSVAENNTSGGAGGGFSVTGGPGALRIERSTVVGNSASAGGGLEVSSNRIGAVSQSTFVGNSAGGAGGGVRLDHAGARLDLDHATFTGNSSGAHVAAGRLRLHGTVIGESSGGSDCSLSGGEVLAMCANLDTDGSCAALGGAAISTVPSFDLGPLAEGEGPTPTRFPLAQSPVLDGDPACETAPGAPLGSDQRGLHRPADDDGDGQPECDLGAVERGPIFLDGFESGSAARWSSHQSPIGPFGMSERCSAHVEGRAGTAAAFRTGDRLRAWPAGR
ncbi:MAG: hypothetical protein K8I65_04335 [Thermoanaerobaculia bacterium]|nr:hypothetical protein [Thermoanaerobaculia bacterium]